MRSTFIIACTQVSFALPHVPSLLIVSFELEPLKLRVLVLEDVRYTSQGHVIEETIVEEDLVVGDKTQAELNSGGPCILRALVFIGLNRLDFLEESFQCFLRIDAPLAVLSDNFLSMLVDDVLTLRGAASRLLIRART